MRGTRNPGFRSCLTAHKSSQRLFRWAATGVFIKVQYSREYIFRVLGHRIYGGGVRKRVHSRPVWWLARELQYGPRYGQIPGASFRPCNYLMLTLPLANFCHSVVYSSSLHTVSLFFFSYVDTSLELWSALNKNWKTYLYWSLDPQVSRWSPTSIQKNLNQRQYRSQ